MAAVKSIESKPTMNGIQTKIVMHEKVTSLKVMAELMGLIAPDKPAPLEDYSKSTHEERRLLLDAPEELYAELIEG
jgi:hypothetical protein